MTALWPGRGGPAVDYISPPPAESLAALRPRRVALLGSTGSIGRNALSVVEASGGRLEIVGLACGRNVELLARQALRHRPPVLSVLDDAAAEALRPLLPPGYTPEILTGRAGYARLAALTGAQAVLSAQVGAAGLTATLAAALAGKMVALANKESLVLAGALVRAICAGTGAAVLPVDSEHDALFQCVAGRRQEVKNLVLTASGGPFRGRSARELARVTPEAALAHPNWRMGAKISIDSATLMNKGLELIEAVHLYGVAPARVRILVHPQSVVHSLAEFADGSFMAQLGAPDMRLPIGHCLDWPVCAGRGAPALDLAKVGSLTFEEPDAELFPCLSLAREALLADRAALGGAPGFGPACVALNAANEAAVELFLNGGCGFTDIPALVSATLDALPGLDEGRALAPLSPGELPRGPLDEARAAKLALELAARVDALDRACRALVRRRAAHPEEPKC
ncbi:MAG: 1-deoxy-D-xylulose-5-phosphate reductoisomerase [Desulfovibrio sp.]|nr:1-deoxy-D-xylulose-5-phosphate reductoisomerase [Desulfovibrio sp.]